MIATITPTEPSPSPSPSVPPPPLVPCALSLVPLSPRDESLLLSLLECGPSLAFLIRRHKMTLQEALDWWRQPHIKQALADLADLSQARAKAIASNDAMQAVSALQSSLILCESEFCEQADPRTRLKAFDSARKAAVQVLKLAGIPSARSRAPSRTPSRAITRGPARVMPSAAHPATLPPNPQTPRPPVPPGNARVDNPSAVPRPQRLNHLQQPDVWR